ncbi:hypothetical protein GCM10007989_18430 [Devosia pacifica]|uniref:Uncharacterized protein n=1 Tax=Devosia pacifica TaxID=1335967 RepID=A0A918S460_9HYPH|nr:hypothetical protein [Devosia pacifica]GHA23265.1 hypothetical protein GCM10007989_18430 [Devosia pacifica]
MTFEMVRRRFPWAIHALVLVLIIIFATLPLIGVFVAEWLAGAAGHDCRLDEAGIYPCEYFGINVGGLLGALFAMGWLALVTLPLGAVALVAWIVIMFVHRHSWHNKKHDH